MEISRRALQVTVAGALAGAALVASAPSAWSKDGDRAAWAKDLDFLLGELGKDENAGRLLKQKDIDWTAVSRDFRAEMKSVKDDAEFVALAGRLVARLRDGHACLTNLKVQPPDERNGRRLGGPGLILCDVDRKVHVRNAWGPAEDEGLAPGMEVVKIEGVPARKWLDERAATLADTTGFSTDQHALFVACHGGLADVEGSKIALEVSTGRAVKRVSVTRRGDVGWYPRGPVFPPKDAKTEGRHTYGKTAKGYGYIHLRDAPGELPEQLDKMLEEIGDVPGLVLDCRANGGGATDHPKVFGRFLTPGQKWVGDEGATYVGEGRRPFSGPMVVIVDAGTLSAGETVSGMFKEDSRAYMIGESPTAGMSSQKKDITVPSGLFGVHFSFRSNKHRFNGGRGIEGIGVPPHEVVPYDPKDLAAGVDTQIRRAEELLAKGFPGGKVLYKPPK